MQIIYLKHSLVSTHSRPKAAARLRVVFGAVADVSTHSRPKAAARRALAASADACRVSTHSRPKAAAFACNALRI